MKCGEEAKYKIFLLGPPLRNVGVNVLQRSCANNKTTSFLRLCMFHVVSQTHAMKWIEHINFCGNVDSYEVSSARTDEHCKYACARDSKCFMVMYDPKENYCWKSSSYIRHSRKCTSKLNFYQKGKSFLW